MNTSSNVRAIMQNTRRYWYVDGLADIGMAAFLILMGLVLGAQAFLPEGSPLWLIVGFGWPVLLIGGGLVVNWAVQQLKARYTYPRTGYVSYEGQGSSRAIRFAAVFIVSALIAAGVVAFSRGWYNLTLLFGLAFGLAFVYVAVRSSLLRYAALSAWSLFAGVALALTALSRDQGGAVFFIAVGLALLLSGGVTFRSYLQQTAGPRAEV